MKKTAYSLRQSLLGPLVGLLLGTLLFFGYFIWSFYGEYTGLLEKISLTSKVSKHTMEVTRSRSRTQEILLFYRQTQNKKYLAEYSDMLKTRNFHLKQLRVLAEQSPSWKYLGQALISGLSEAQSLQSTVIAATQSGDIKRADTALSLLTTIFEINSARLKDFSLRLQAELRQQENELERLLSQSLFAFALLTLALFSAIWFISIIYRRGVLLPLQRLHSGMQALAQGNMSVEIAPGSSPREIDEMMKDFNKMVQVLKTTQDDLTHAREEALKAARIKSDFLSNMSHEIRTPMNTIIGMADELAEGELSAEKRKYVQILRNSGKILINIINDILDYSKLEAGRVTLERTVFDLRDLAQKTGEVIGVTAKLKGLHFAVEVHPDSPCWVLGDSNRLEQILLNLLGNAVKFTEKGSVKLRIEIECHLNVTHTRVLITDTGVGMQKEDLDRLFERFTQSDSSVTRKFGGTGLGLAIVKQLLDLMNGSISVQSELNKGTQFLMDFSLPAAKPKSEQSKIQNIISKVTEENSEEVALQSLSGKDILLVDDSADNRFLIETYLRKSGANIITADNGLSAFQLYKAEHFDIVLMDMQMPVMDGYSATAAIRTFEKNLSRSPTPIVALTAFALNSEVEKSLKAGCDRHLTKPVRKHDLVMTIADLVK